MEASENNSVSYTVSL